MIGIVVAAHGDLPKGFKSSIELLMGEQPNTEYLGLYHGMDPALFVDELRKAIESCEQGDGVLVFTDFFGGTPNNSACQLVHEIPFGLISGINLPMYIEALDARDTMALDALVEHLVKFGKTQIFDSKAYLQELATQDQEDDF